jgi:hypothetical protein
VEGAGVDLGKRQRWEQRGSRVSRAVCLLGCEGVQLFGERWSFAGWAGRPAAEFEFLLSWIAMYFMGLSGHSVGLASGIDWKNVPCIELKYFLQLL